jgi:hypothetical protein
MPAKMNFRLLPLYVLALAISAMAFAQSEAQKPATQKDEAQKAAAPSAQSAGEIILIGEIHGTQETPRLFGNLVTVAAGETNGRIGVGLELPITLQALVDEAVRNNATIDSFRGQLLAHPDWKKINDGRSSQAMLDLISNLLRLAQSHKLALFFFDTQINARDDTMAQYIGQRARAQHYDLTLALAGNVHANKAPHHPLLTKTVPMGYRLVEQGFVVHSYDVGFSDGEAWACTPQCGVHNMGDWNAVPDPSAKSQQGYDGVLSAGTVHASPIAHESGPAKAGQ